jgi:hypothetical protein
MDANPSDIIMQIFKYLMVLQKIHEILINSSIDLISNNPDYQYVASRLCSL